MVGIKYPLSLADIGQIKKITYTRHETATSYPVEGVIEFKRDNAVRTLYKIVEEKKIGVSEAIGRKEECLKYIRRAGVSNWKINYYDGWNYDATSKWKWDIIIVFEDGDMSVFSGTAGNTPLWMNSIRELFDKPFRNYV